MTPDVLVWFRVIRGPLELFEVLSIQLGIPLEVLLQVVTSTFQRSLVVHNDKRVVELISLQHLSQSNSHRHAINSACKQLRLANTARTSPWPKHSILRRRKRVEEDGTL